MDSSGRKYVLTATLFWRIKNPLSLSTSSVSENADYDMKPYAPSLLAELSDFAAKRQTRRSTMILCETWHHLCSTYNQSLLTLRDDKLPALSGMPRYVADATGDQYVLGLWRSSLIRDLLWSYTPDTSWNEHLEALSLANGLNAPSWSWMIHNKYFERGTEEFPLNYDHTFVNECQICRIEISYATTNEFGRIGRSALTSSGRLLLSSHHFVRSPNQNSTVTVWLIYHEGRPIYTCHLDWAHEAAVVHPPDGLMMFKLGTSPIYTMGERSFRMQYGVSS